MKISNDQIIASYNIAKRVYTGEIEKEQGAEELQKIGGMNRGSARDYIKNFHMLMSGHVFHRTMNAFATDYYFTNIKNDFGIESLALAIKAVQEHVRYYEGIRPSKLHSIREVIDRHLPFLERPLLLSDYETAFSLSVLRSLQEPSKDRKKRLSQAPRLPRKIMATSEIFLRNPDVVAEVLLRAGGVCERCKKPAPFLRNRDQTPYLEVHHTIQLALGGEDTVENALALCPNCHRELHFGVKILTPSVPA